MRKMKIKKIEQSNNNIFYDIQKLFYYLNLNENNKHSKNFSFTSHIHMYSSNLN